RLADGLENAGPLVADVAGVDAAVPGDDAGQGDEFLGLGVGAGVVDQAGGHAPGAVVYAAVHERFHLPQFLSGRLAVGGAHNRLPVGVVRHQVDDVAADSAGFQRLEVDRHVRGAGAAVAGDDGGDALEKVGLVGAGGGTGQGRVAVRVQVDEA